MKIPLTIPNVVTALRIPLLTAMWVFFYAGQNVLIGIFLLLSGATDILDGYLARRLNQQTQFGARFDAAMDYLVGISMIVWIPILLPALLEEHKGLIIGMIVFVVVSWMIIFALFRRHPEISISSKLAASVGYLFYVHAVIVGYNTLFFYITIISTIIMVVTEMVITVRKPLQPTGKIK